MCLLVPLSSLSPSEKKLIGRMEQRCSQCKCIAKEHEKLDRNKDGDASAGAFKEVHVDCVGNSPEDKCPSMRKLEQAIKRKNASLMVAKRSRSHGM